MRTRLILFTWLMILGILGGGSHETMGQSLAENQCLFILRTESSFYHPWFTIVQLKEPFEQLLAGPDAIKELKDVLTQADPTQHDRIQQALQMCDHRKLQPVVIAILKMPDLMPVVRDTCGQLLRNCTRQCEDLSLLEMAEKETQPDFWSVAVAQAFELSQPERAEALGLKWARTDRARPQYRDCAYRNFCLLRELDTPEITQFWVDEMEKGLNAQPLADIPLFGPCLNYLATSRNDNGLAVVWKVAADSRVHVSYRLSALHGLALRVPDDQLPRVVGILEECRKADGYDMSGSEALVEALTARHAISKPETEVLPAIKPVNQ